MINGDGPGKNPLNLVKLEKVGNDSLHEPATISNQSSSFRASTPDDTLSRQLLLQLLQQRLKEPKQTNEDKSRGNTPTENHPGINQKSREAVTKNEHCEVVILDEENREEDKCAATTERTDAEIVVIDDHDDDADCEHNESANIIHIIDDDVDCNDNSNTCVKTEKAVVICCICCQKFDAANDEYRLHLLAHYELFRGKTLCFHCQVDCGSNDRMIDHFMIVHGGVNKLVCPDLSCIRQFRTQKSLQMHLKKHQKG